MLLADAPVSAQRAVLMLGSRSTRDGSITVRSHLHPGSSKLCCDLWR
ncbi:hypothetical protein SynBIOSE41_04336 [Synechococcus sp. BIOS-E4-1]|nr:hypothetical protein SynBIOSE41_04336 [Synechococcus sp. BIOS-E4-1]